MTQSSQRNFTIQGTNHKVLALHHSIQDGCSLPRRHLIVSLHTCTVVSLTLATLDFSSLSLLKNVKIRIFSVAMQSITKSCNELPCNQFNDQLIKGVFSVLCESCPTFITPSQLKSSSIQVLNNYNETVMQKRTIRTC